MIIVELGGGLGNQLYQYALGRYLSIRHHTELKLDVTNCEVDKNTCHNYYRLGEFNIQENFATAEEIARLKKITPPVSAQGFNKEILKLNNAYLCGNWNDFRYFQGIRDTLLKELTLKNPLHENSAHWKKKILSAKNSVSLHVRLGDYTGTLWRNKHRWVLDIGFYIECINELKKTLSYLTIFVFSDDLNLAKYMFENNINIPMEFVSDCESDAEELYLMSLCKHNIVPVSTFSSWAAWLNQNPNKKVFSVMFWAQINNWIGIPDKSSFNPNFGFSPFISIILYVENDIFSIDMAMQSILTQQFGDYEVIIIDTSADGSGEICRKYAQNENVTVIRANYTTNKFEAWNMGLKIARSSYVTFMTAKDFIFPHSIALIANYALNRFPSANFDNWEMFIPDIICATQYLEENISGDINIGLPDKKFSLKVDEPFKDLNQILEIKIDSQQKLFVLSTQQINNLLSTKFFKRKFLVDNKIKLSENNLNRGGVEISC